MKTTFKNYFNSQKLINKIILGVFSILSFISLFTLFTSNTDKLEGFIRYKRTENWVKKYAALDYISEKEKAKDAYVWGTRSEWSSYCEFYFDESKSKYFDSEEMVDPSMQAWSYKKPQYLIFRDFRNQHLEENIEILGKLYHINDTLIPQNWKILNDMKEVAGHICMNAEWMDTIKFQKVIAWFALDIPIPGGPEMFSGLPGLILEVEVNNGAMIITADKIELKNIQENFIHKKKLKGKNITKSQYNSIINEYIQDQKKVERPYFWGLRY